MTEHTTAPDVVGRMLRRATWVAAATTVAAAVLGLVVWSPAAAISAVLGGAIAGGALSGGLAAVRWLLGQQQVVVLPGAFMILLVVVILLAATALVLREQEWLHRTVFAFSALAVAVAHQVALVQAYLSGPRPVVDVALPGEGGPR